MDYNYCAVYARFLDQDDQLTSDLLQDLTIGNALS